jgi:hypothetical protein
MLVNFDYTKITPEETRIKMNTLIETYDLNIGKKNETV